jgi:hypothetical protein
MAAHISTKQVVDYIKTVKKVSVDGIIYEKVTIDDTNITIDKHVFPLDYFDIGGMDPNSLILVGTDHEFHRVQFHDENNVTLNHPEWEIEAFDGDRVRNRNVSVIASNTKFTK